MSVETIKSLCQQYTNYPVKLTARDGVELEAIIEYVDNENAHVLYPVDENEKPIRLSQLEGFSSAMEMRYPYSYPYYGYPPYGFGVRPFGWRRWVLPLAALAAIALL
ncbi:Uncharacterised protein [Niallia circulans]|uniref:Uncharacterized protein n=1 Tax=Shouchella clausii TaxID=79880 RepID=A0A268RUA8_SHOCL|nr:hypothetical protein [Shouchella clausii]PAD40711.1 hypothetical protein CHH54_21145 [Bacillus sp. 7520-S]SPU22286.1 Uncharacterised protein [Niallia circulans]MBU8595197.1 hypothetical protein [Shouchella clausii]MCM3549641.1 hypothetical protein [Shouchella clausii]MCY1103256.1 hypothetical protein [Shouchella clausii]